MRKMGKTKRGQWKRKKDENDEAQKNQEKMEKKKKKRYEWNAISVQRTMNMKTHRRIDKKWHGFCVPHQSAVQTLQNYHVLNENKPF